MENVSDATGADHLLSYEEEFRWRTEKVKIRSSFLDCICKRLEPKNGAFQSVSPMGVAAQTGASM